MKTVEGEAVKGKGKVNGLGKEGMCTDKCPKRTENSEWSLACSTVAEVRKEHHHQHLLLPISLPSITSL